MEPSDPVGEMTTVFFDAVFEGHFEAVSKTTEDLEKHRDQGCSQNGDYGSNMYQHVPITMWESTGLESIGQVLQFLDRCMLCIHRSMQPCS